MNYQEELSSFAEGFQLKQVDEAKLRRAKLILLDSITAIVEGNQTDHMIKLQDEMLKSKRQHEANRAFIYGTNKKSEPHLAAFVNGVAMVSQEMDEGNPVAKGHPSCHYLPSMLAFSEMSEVSGFSFLESFVVGYEIGARAGAAIQLKNNIHPHGNWGLIGSSFAIGKLQGFTKKEYEASFSMGSSLPNVSLWTPVIEGHRIRDVYIGLNNLHACLIPTLVRAGFSSSPTSIEEIYGDGILGEKLVPEKLVEGLGETFYLMNTYFKFYSFCRFCHSPIDGMRKLLQREELSAESIDTINVYTYSLAAKLSHQEVSNEYAGKFSIPYAISSTVLPNASHEQIVELAKKVFVFEDEELTKLLPHKRNSRVEVITKDKRKVVEHVEGATGDSSEQNLEERVLSKCKRTLQAIIGPTRTDELVTKVMNLENVEDMRSVLKLLVL